MKKRLFSEFSIQIKCLIWVFICNVLQKGISVLTTPLFTRILTTEEYGNFSVFNSWLGIVTVVVSMELYKSVFEQGMVKFEEERDCFYASMQSLTLSMILVWFIAYLLTRKFWNKLLGLTTTQFAMMFILITTTAIFRFWACEQRIFNKYKLLVFVTMLVSVLKPCLSLVLICLMENNVDARILGITLAEILGYSIVFIDRIRKKGLRYSSKYWKYGVSLGVSLIPHYLSQTVLESADRIMIEKLSGDSCAGIYSLASSASGVLLLINSSLLYSLSPWIYNKIKNREYKDIARIEYFAMILVGFANLMLIGLAPEIIQLFAPAQYYEAVWVVPPISISSFFIFLYELFARFEFYYEKTLSITLATSICATLNCILNYICIPKFGYVAAGYTTLLCYIFNAVWHYVVLLSIEKKQKIFGGVYSKSKIVSISLFFLVTGLSFSFLYSVASIFRYISILIIVVFAGLTAYKIGNVVEFNSFFKKNKQ